MAPSRSTCASILAASLACGCHGTPAFRDAQVDVDAPVRDGAGPGGGLLTDLRFAIIGDTRPTLEDDTTNYPTAVVTQIWEDIAAETPAIQFAVATGDFMYASSSGGQVDPQLDLYLGARGNYLGALYPTMGNHECNALTQSNCGPGNSDGTPTNYDEFLARLVAPTGETKPYYIERFAAPDGSWTAKLVVIAANAWTTAQADWLDAVLAEPTSYTFAARHEPSDATAAPGVAPSQAILAMHPVTLVIGGHVHQYSRGPANDEIVVGNGGAPLSGVTNYGYVVIARQPDATLQITAYDYMTHAVVDQFAVNAAGDVQ
jgi:hypothetical protein